MSIYSCKECNAPASVVDARVVRTCEHHDGVVIANLSATLYGESRTKAAPTVADLRALFVRLFNRFAAKLRPAK